MKYDAIDPNAELAVFIQEKHAQAAWAAWLAELDEKQIARLAADPESVITEQLHDDAVQKVADAAAKRDAIPVDVPVDLADRKTKWNAERLAQLEREHVCLTWLRDNPALDDDTEADRAEQVRQVEAAIAVLPKL